MADIKVSGRMSVKRLQKEFKDTFNLSLRIYVGNKFADESSTLASIRKKDDTKSADLNIRGNMKVGSLENLFMSELGIKIQIANFDDTKLVSNDLTIASAAKGTTPSNKAKKENKTAPKKEGSSPQFSGFAGSISTQNKIKDQNILLFEYCADYDTLDENGENTDIEFSSFIYDIENGTLIAVSDELQRGSSVPNFSSGHWSISGSGFTVGFSQNEGDFINNGLNDSEFEEVKEVFGVTGDESGFFVELANYVSHICQTDSLSEIDLGGSSSYERHLNSIKEKLNLSHPASYC